MKDIVNELREQATVQGYPVDNLLEAACEIERLRAEVASLKELKEQHKSLLDVYRQNMHLVTELQEQNALLAAQGQRCMEALEGVVDSGLLIGPTVLHDMVLKQVYEAIHSTTELPQHKSEDAIVRDALILAKDVINILWVSHHANRADAAIAAIDAAMSVKSEDAMDAARYRWLRADIDGRVEIATELIQFNADVFLDAEIDKAISAQEEKA